MRRLALPILAVAAFLFAAPAAHADSLGDSRTFHVDSDFDLSGAESIPATLRAISSDAYVYVDDRYWVTLSDAAKSAYQSSIQQLANEFSSPIHPRATAFWGSEPNPGVDGDPRLTLLMERVIGGNGGYFRTINSYPKNEAPESNAREMVYLAADSASTTLGRAFLAHEFQHLISFNQKELLQRVSDDVWLNEARSEYDVTVVGYDTPYENSPLQRRVFSFTRTPSDSLVEWPNTSTDYGIASMFIHYLADRYGSALLQSTIHSRQRGVHAIEEWLSANGRPENFGDIFADWMAAVVINDPTDARYGYRTPGLDRMHVTPSDSMRVSTSPANREFQLKEWQPSWVTMEVPTSANMQTSLNVRVSGPDVQGSSNFIGGTAMADYGGTSQIIPWRGLDGSGAVSIPTTSGGRTLRSVAFAFAFGDRFVTQDDSFPSEAVSLTAWLGDSIATMGTPAPAPAPGAPSGPLKDGDLIRLPGQAEVYVIWGPYRRYLMPGVLELYGFQNRPVTVVSNEVLNSYRSSNYIRVVDKEPVYAVWPDGTKHWFNITAAQWDASAREWGAIFIVNDLEANFYTTGADITR